MHSCARSTISPKWGPTTANSQPQRIVFLRSAQAKERLAPALSKTNLKQDHRRAGRRDPCLRSEFYEHLGRMFHQSGGAQLV